MGKCCSRINTEENRNSLSFEWRMQRNIAENTFSSEENEWCSQIYSAFFKVSIEMNPGISSEFDTLINSKEVEAGSVLHCSLNTMETVGKCLCGGNFQYHESLVFENFLKSNTWNINCGICAKVFSDSGWKCLGCMQTVCIKCGNLKNLYRPLAKCFNSHDLVFFPDTAARFSDKKFYTCPVCLHEKREPSWTCMTCNYNLCLTCSYSLDIFPPFNTLLCFEKKTLSFELVKKGNNEHCQCSKCYKYPNTEKYWCKDCEFCLCGNCMVDESYKMSQHPGLRCTKGHEFRIGLVKIFKRKVKKWIICNKCSGANMKFIHACEKCEQYLCLECASDIAQKIRKNTGKICEQGHFLLWSVLGDHGKEDFVCENCCKTFEVNSFLCENCHYDVCVDCMEHYEFL